jgi:hypothetical protein
VRQILEEIQWELIACIEGGGCAIMMSAAAIAISLIVLLR